MTLIWGGLSLGAVYALVAIGYNVVFTASGTFNFAHAQLIMLGTFLAYWGLAVLHWPLALVFVLCTVIVGLVAAAEERLAIRTVRGTEAQLVTTVGVATLINGVTQLVWGSQPLTVPVGDPTTVWSILGGRVLPVELLLIAVAIAMTIGLVLYSRYTMTGLAVLATAENREAAALRGVNVRMLALGAFALSGALAGVVGPIVGPKTFAVATLGAALALKGFVALALGGFGSLTGGLVGGFVVGLVEQFSARYLGSAYVNLAIFALLLIVLLLRPSGLFVKATEREV